MTLSLDPLVQAMQAAADGGDAVMAAWIARHGLPRLVRQREDGQVVYADTGEVVPCACGRQTRCARCHREITRRRLASLQAWQQQGLAL